MLCTLMDNPHTVVFCTRIANTPSCCFLMANPPSCCTLMANTPSCCVPWWPTHLHVVHPDDHPPLSWVPWSQTHFMLFHDRQPTFMLYPDGQYTVMFCILMVNPPSCCSLMANPPSCCTLLDWATQTRRWPPLPPGWPPRQPASTMPSRMALGDTHYLALYDLSDNKSTNKIPLKKEWDRNVGSFIDETKIQVCSNSVPTISYEWTEKWFQIKKWFNELN